MKTAVKGIVGKTISGVIAARNDTGTGSPRYRVFLMFPDSTYYEFYCCTDDIHGAGGVGDGGLDEVMRMVTANKHSVNYSSFDVPKIKGSYAEKLERLAVRWDKNGNAPEFLLTKDWDRMVSLYWRSKHESECSFVLSEFIDANKAAVDEDAWHSVLCSRFRCNRTGDTYKLDNLSICVLCDRTWFGGGVCSCGGELVG